MKGVAIAHKSYVERVPAEPLARMLNQLHREYELPDMAQRTGVNVETIRSLVHRKYPRVTITLADQIATAYDRSVAELYPDHYDRRNP